ncbi:HpcH/HpaI aldolase/citrate lyase family protein [Pantoea sp. At-9b]|uniref:HpcH/HpaI aldolase family protein n=1 Tax=Pantoea sp. (strain At-9b) TaxID=592316 RepID=UPI0001B3EE1A|nr:aldolase/citrate lyase family protein [Pantoea sp. At-9b]ADU72011.1 HpcH/HpaI aldolase [Pantoea sp. At-9b]
MLSTKTGTFCQLMSPVAAESLCLAGFDFLIADAEHSALSDAALLNFVHATSRWPEKLFIRVRDSLRSTLLRSMDMAPAGIIIPDVHTLEEIKQIVRHTKYYPLGHRGVAFGRNAAYGMDPTLKTGMENFFSGVNTRCLVIPQCETLGALDNIEQFCAIDGVDGIFVGPYDLSVACNLPGELRHPVIQEAIARILRACKSQQKIAMIFAADKVTATAYAQQGFDYIAVGTDTQFMLQGAATLLS